MKIWIQIEALINKILLKIGASLLKLMPKRLLGFVSQITQFFSSLSANLKSSIQKTNQEINAKLKSILTSTKTKLKNSDKTVNQFLKEIKNIKPKDLKEKTLSFLRSSIAVIANMPRKKNTTSFIAIGLCLWGVYTIHYSAELFKNKTKGSRSIASVQEVDSKYQKPAYHLKRLKTLHLTNVQLPVFFSKTNDYKTINLDFSLVASNKHIPLFLDQHEEVLRNHLIMNVKQVLPEFTIGNEGKKIIKEKIILETNKFLQKYEVVGEVQEVRVSNILANP